MHVTAAAEEFDLMPPDLAHKVVNRLRDQATDPPSVAEIRTCARMLSEASRTYVPPQLPRSKEIPPEARDALDRFRARFANNVGALRARLHGARSPEEREQAARDLARAQYLEEVQKPEPEPELERVPGRPSRYREGMCSGVGKHGVLADGVVLCPDCRSPIKEGCHPVATQQSQGG